MPAAICTFASFPLAFTAADSARVVAQVYSIGLLATVPLAIAAGAALALHRASAGTRALVWRCAAVALLLIFLGRVLAVKSLAFVVPEVLASPLVALGRVEVSVTPFGAGATRDGTVLIWTLLLAYSTGVVAVLVSIVRGWFTARALVRRALHLDDSRWFWLVDDVRRTLGIRANVRLALTSELPMPVTCGIWRPVVLLPNDALRWTESDIRAVILHELGHVKGRDIAFALLARLGCALYWYHPGAWLVARGLRDDCEVACDDRVLAAGVKPSDYAELLANAAERCTSGQLEIMAALTGRHGGLRGRLAAIVDTDRRRGAPTRATLVAATVLTVGVAIPVIVAELAPTREVLTRLMRDAAWESRAYAVIGLARRPDSVAAVRSAAVLDPSPRVRALAEAALSLR